MAYTYNNGICNRRVEILPGWRRFKSCNAQECKRVFEVDNMPRFIVWQLISYETPLIQVSKDLIWYTWDIVCNGNPFGYSTSTTRQVEKWIRCHAFPFTAHELKNAFIECKSITPNVSTFRVTSDDGVPLSFEFRSSYAFNRIWR